MNDTDNQSTPRNTCSTCRWWLKNPTSIEPIGECHGGPPTAIAMQVPKPFTGEMEIKIFPAWSDTPATQWRKEHDAIP